MKTKKMLMVSSVLAIVAGFAMIIGGLWAIFFTYNNVSRENITTPDDATIPGARVLGPLTLRSQAEIIRDHTLHSTGGKTYSEMPSKIPMLDENNNAILDASGAAVMVPNGARATWITATTLITALNLGIITYVFSAIVLFFGLISIWTGLTFRALSKRD